jgi:hypothetical protein
VGEVIGQALSKLHHYEDGNGKGAAHILTLSGISQTVMREYLGVIINASFLSLFYVIRCLVLNVNVLFNIVWIIEGLIVVGLLVVLSLRKYNTKGRIAPTLIHISTIVAFLLIAGHLVSICTLQLYHYRAIEVFKCVQSKVPVADRVNGRWILDIPAFSITDEERTVLEENFSKSSPCFFDEGYCYFELGGFLKSSGGYCIKLNDVKQVPGSFGFHRIRRTISLIENWKYYE